MIVLLQIQVVSFPGLPFFYSSIYVHNNVKEQRLNTNRRVKIGNEANIYYAS